MVGGVTMGLAIRTTPATSPSGGCDRRFMVVYIRICAFGVVFLGSRWRQIWCVEFVAANVCL
ncbi:hypothetical protein A2U01_0083821 [Trifolium medium]|uniref:Uncharacterized protein n=1 Tax=Trifolium medium TaxID=97028 RepID=A0A392TPJ8_9FABA|nr:hypothetical protein [Trifolium medium]